MPNLCIHFKDIVFDHICMRSVRSSSSPETLLQPWSACGTCAQVSFDPSSKLLTTPRCRSQLQPFVVRFLAAERQLYPWVRTASFQLFARGSQCLLLTQFAHQSVCGHGIFSVFVCVTTWLPRHTFDHSFQKAASGCGTMCWSQHRTPTDLTSKLDTD